MTDRPELTKYEFRALEELRRFQTIEGYTPNVRELAERMGLSSHSTASLHVRRLIEKGYVERLGSRALRIIYP